MKKKGKIIGVDMDDVLIEFNEHFCRYHNRLYGTNMEKKDIFSFDLEKVWKTSREKIVKKVIDFCMSHDHDEASPVPGSIDALKELSKNNKLVVVTSRGDEIKDLTMKWLNKHFRGIFSDVYFTNSFPGNEKRRKKSEVCRELGIEVFIDDAPEHAKDISAAGIRVLLYDCPWNRQGIPEEIKRVHSWEEVVGNIK